MSRAHESGVLRWLCRGRELQLGGRARIMGILNVTPDSFSDGGLFLVPDAAVEHGEEMAAAGADILDVGGASSRPGALDVPVDEEIERVVPVLERLAARTDVLLSVDTCRAAVARRALQAGAHIVNDISALGDRGMAAVVKEFNAGLVLMHMQGRPATMQHDPRYADVVGDVRSYLQHRMNKACAAGIDPRAVALDPGIGFGKRLEHNTGLLAGIPSLAELGRPLQIGLSRKSMLGALTGRPVNERLAAGLGGLAYAVMRGAHILRVHEVKESCDVAVILDILQREEQDGHVVAGQTCNNGLERGR